MRRKINKMLKINTRVHILRQCEHTHTHAHNTHIASIIYYNHTNKNISNNLSKYEQQCLFSYFFYSTFSPSSPTTTTTTARHGTYVHVYTPRPGFRGEGGQ